MRIVFREEGITGAQGGVMDAEMFFEHLAAPADRTKPFACCFAKAIVPAQIGARLLAFENRGHARLSSLWTVRRHVGAITTLRQADFRGTGGIAIRLGPQHRETFEAQMRFGFRAANRYWRVHSASSFAQ